MNPLCNSSRRVFRGGLLAFTYAILAIASPASAWAQAGGAPAAGHSDVMAYMLVLFCVALGMIILCRSAARSSEIKLEDLDED